MELKVWVDGVARVVCGLSLNTSCQDVVIALAQSIGRTGRYILIVKLRGTERQLQAEDCPLQHLAQLGQQATEVQFILRRTGPSSSSATCSSSSSRPAGRTLTRQTPCPSLKLTLVGLVLWSRSSRSNVSRLFDINITVL
uniref:Ras-associating domain-containing protein n=1 Tax=Anabas testudineus TaxID=64144 RepID=A0A3Q1IZG1_ANATE